MKKFINDIRIIYFIIYLSPIVLIGIFALYFEEGTIMQNDLVENTYLYLIPVLGLIFFSLGSLIFNKRLKAIKRIECINLRLQEYRVLVIRRIAFLGVPAMLSAVAFIVTLNWLFVTYAVISLTIYFLIFPTAKRVKIELNIEPELIDLQNYRPIQKKRLLSKPWFIILLIISGFILNYNSCKKLINNRIVLPTNQANSGTINEGVYRNDYLDWTFVIPSGYEVIPPNQITHIRKRGSEIFGTSDVKKNKRIELLNISKGSTTFMSNLNARVLYPNLSSEEKYFELLLEKLQEINSEELKFEKQFQGSIQIGNLDFKFVEYLLIGPNFQGGTLFFSRFNHDYILDLGISYLNPDEAIEFLNKLKNSELNWQ